MGLETSPDMLRTLTRYFSNSYPVAQLLAPRCSQHGALVLYWSAILSIVIHIRWPPRLYTVLVIHIWLCILKGEKGFSMISTRYRPVQDSEGMVTKKEWELWPFFWQDDLKWRQSDCKFDAGAYAWWPGPTMHILQYIYPTVLISILLFSPPNRQRMPCKQTSNKQEKLFTTGKSCLHYCNDVV